MLVVRCVRYDWRCMGSMAVFGTICALVLVPVLRGFVLTLLWKWFVVPVFHVPLLRIPEALGVALIITFLTYGERKESPPKEFSSRMVFTAISALVVLGLGYIYKLFL